MRIYSLLKLARSYPSLCLVVLCIALCSSVALYAHSGASLSAPTGATASIVIDGTINNSTTEATWGAGTPVGPLPNNCDEFNNSPPPPSVTLHALNDGARLFLAFDIPDTSANANDAMFLFFDSNHGGGGAPAADDRAIRLTFNNISAVNQTPDAEHFTGTGAVWSAGTAGLPPGMNANDVKYTRQTTGAGKWQVEIRAPLSLFSGFGGTTLGFAFLYLNAAGGAEDCNNDGTADDFYTRFPSTLTISAPISLPAGIANPSAWGNLDFGPAPPTVRFQPPLCCFSSDINFSPSTLPFTSGTPVNIRARVHNLHTSAAASNVNLEIRVHDFGTGGGGSVVFATPAVVSSVPASGADFSNFVVWASPPAGLHGCIRAEIKPHSTSPYLIAPGFEVAQYNIDVACIPKGQKKQFKFNAFNPDPKQEAKIFLVKQELLPAGLEGLRFELQQPDRPLRPLEEAPVFLTVTAADNLPTTQVPKQAVKLPPTAGGAAVPPLSRRSGTEPLSIAVKPGDRLHLTASGEVDIDGSGPLSAVGPEGGDFSKELREQRRFLLSGESASRFAGALIASFDAFKTSFVAGSEITLTAPEGVERLWLAVNDLDAGYDDNIGSGFEVEAATLPALEVPAVQTQAAKAAPAILPQVNISAATTARVTVGRAVYNLLTNHGGVTYQFLVVDAQGAHGKGVNWPFGLPWWVYLLLLLLLFVLLLIVWLLRRKFRPAS